MIPIVDLRKRFGLSAGEATEQTRIIVVNAAKCTFGIVVDAVSQVLRVDKGQIEPPPTGLTGLDRAYIHGLLKLGEKIMILLNMDNVLSSQEFSMLAKSSNSGT